MDIKSIKGVGPKTLKVLNSIGIYSTSDMLYYFPRGYEDRNNKKTVDKLIDGENAVVNVEVSLIMRCKRTRTGKSINRIVFKDDTGYLTGVWFNKPYMSKTFKIGENIILYGTIKINNGEIEIIEPQYEKIKSEEYNGIIPIYPLSKNITQNALRKISNQCINSVNEDIKECLPIELKKRYELEDIDYAIKNIHFPESFDALNKSIRRVKFDELLKLQLALFLIKNQYENDKTAYKINPCPQIPKLIESLPYKLTNSQKNAVDEVIQDLNKNKAMNRLVQGDVGSGKTIIAIIALFDCAMNGIQCAMMAPTEILAQQNYESIKKVLQKWDLNIQMLSGSTSKKDKDDILMKLKNGEINIIVGTHSLIQDDIEFKNLGLVITDEQHRFGVRQRSNLAAKGHNPHVLVMTATPIPRTLALFIYGDMDISIINELPPGRQKVDTYFVRPSLRDRIYKFLKKQIDEGRQGYVICPMVSENGDLDVSSVEQMAVFLKNNYFRNYKIGVIHGKLNYKEKEKIMKDFYNKKIQVLVSTTVVEVGINVPNATVMVVEDADRFGLAQLHQLRGRVGRGIYKSYCILIGDPKTSEGLERMKIMVMTNDGFKIAEKDMEIRGTGEFFGLKQHGLPELKLADPIKDIDILKDTREAAKYLIESKKICDDEFKILREETEKILYEKKDDININ
ncbi:MAG TPA: DNA helicase RecG [Clostridiaceae bacterium]|jgi:ATP-dependent DNA helicase RecG|nr:DNA helicase RecG [Clostridiaceae bacterium]